MIDLCHLDEAGFAMTLPTSYSWFLVGQQLRVAYEAPQGRRVNVLGAYFSQGPLSGRFVSRVRVSLPAKTSKKGPHSAVPESLCPQDVGAIDAEVYLEFLWGQVAGRPAGAGADWRRERPVVVVQDNYSVHKSQRVKEERSALEAAGLYLFYLPSYSPELSEIEPVWRGVKYHEMPQRSCANIVAHKQAVETALARKASILQAAHTKTDNSPCSPT